jgi:hypothetical protein
VKAPQASQARPAESATIDATSKNKARSQPLEAETTALIAV